MIGEKQQMKKPHKNPLLIPLAATALVTGMLFFPKTHLNPISIPLYQAIQVFDGDTFETAEKQYIRLSGIDAPESGRCGSEQAKKELEKLIRGKPLYIKILYHLGSRQTGLVYSANGSVNTAMLSSGWAVKYDRDTPNDPAMQRATDEARKKQLGLFSSLCTQSVNPRDATCQIKGNIPYRDNTKTYHTPGCRSYDFTKVELYKGDEWFCSEDQANKAGYSKTKDCY